MALGYRVFTQIERPPQELVAQFAEIATPDLADSMQRAGVVDGNIRPIYRPMGRFAGHNVVCDPEFEANWENAKNKKELRQIFYQCLKKTCDHKHCARGVHNEKSKHK